MEPVVRSVAKGAGGLKGDRSFLRGTGGLKGEGLVKALQEQNWDPGVKSLVPFPQAVAAMNETWKGPSSLATRLQTNRRLSRLDQRLRRSAQKAGSLKTTEQQRVIWSACSRG